MFIKKSIWIILIIFLTACTSPQTAVPPNNATKTFSPEPTILPSATATELPPTPTTPPTPSPSSTIPAPTATPAPMERIAITVITQDHYFYQETTIAFINSDGTGLAFPILQEEHIYGSRGYLAWSPNGRFLTFDGGDTVSCPDVLGTECYDVNYGTFVIDIAQDAILYHIENTFENVSWSPDSQHMVLSIHEDWLEREDPTVDDLYILDVNSGQLKQLTSSPSNDLYPSWSPDGEWIAFVRFAPPAPGCSKFPSSYSENEQCSYASLYRIRPDGSDLQLLYEPIFINGYIEYPSTTKNNAPAWSPDSSSLAFLVKDERGLPDHSNLSIINVETGDWRKISNGYGVISSPAWSPDGHQLAFSWGVVIGADLDIYLWDMDADSTVNLTQAFDYIYYHPIWSPSGARIAYNSRYDLVIMNADGTNKEIIEEEGLAVLGNPAWQPNVQP